MNLYIPYGVGENQMFCANCISFHSGLSLECEHAGHLQGGHAVLREDLQSADVVGHQFVGLLVLVQGQYHAAGIV